MRKTLAVALLAPALGLLGAAPAAAAPAKPAAVKISSAGPSSAHLCRSLGLVGSGPDALFSKMGGCVSSLNAGFLTTFHASKAGYVQQCQVIRAVEGFPFDFGYGIFPDEVVSSIGECATLLEAFHTLPPPPEGQRAR